VVAVTSSRRQFLGSGLAVAFGTISGCVELPGDVERTTSTESGPSGVGAETVATGFTSPIGVEVAPGDSERLFVPDQTGVIHVDGPDGVRDDPLLSVRDRMVELRGYTEQGLLGMAFHPDFDSNRRVFVRYSAPVRGDTPGDYSHTFVLSEFRVGEDYRVAPDSERVVLEIPEPQSNHNAGAVAFGPDDYLYVAVGDGGAGNDVGDGHVEDWYDANRGGNGQDVTANLLGSILRIDVDTRDGGRQYGIPERNPLVGDEGLDEHYAWGLRNPWRLSFTDDRLYVADVGQNRYEEVNLVESGGNYGWNVREGTHCFGTGSSPDSCPTETPDGDPLVDPVVEYAQDDAELGGVSVIGGYEYSGADVPALDGEYVFGDYQFGGDLYVATPGNADEQWPTRAVPVSSPPDSLGEFLLAFGRGHDDELFVATTDSGVPSGETGAVHRLVAAER
jgi:glucose/arabinose dehydrogenase